MCHGPGSASAALPEKPAGDVMAIGFLVPVGIASRNGSSHGLKQDGVAFGCFTPPWFKTRCSRRALQGVPISHGPS